MNDSSREKALEAARELFMQKGKEGVRMQEIADVAEVNKGLLHYYFKSKDNLFKEVFATEAKGLYADINDILKSQASMDEKLSGIIDRYFTLLNDKPGLPAYVMFEINRDPEIIKDFTKDVNLAETVDLLDAEFRANKITSSREFALQVLLNIISLCIFPFTMKPMFRHVTEKVGLPWEGMMDRRKDFLKSIIINSFRP